jgi:hypothetical protein
MFGYYYTPLLALQAFCLYHAYSRRSEQRWYWIIILFPGIGCAIYLYDTFYNRRNIQSLAQGVREAVNSNYRVEQLEKAVRFADNITNKTNLANAYVGQGRYNEAIDLYKSCLTGFMSEDPDLRMKLLYAYFRSEDYATAIGYGKLLENEKAFRNAEARIAYAWSLHHTGQTPEAQRLFEDMDRSFTNYRHRVEYGKFLKATNNKEGLETLLATLMEEFDHIKGPERRLYRNIMAEVRDMHRDYTRA